MERRLLEIYLADHHAAAAAGVELARRATRNNLGTDTGIVLAQVADEIAEDRRTLERLMRTLEMRSSPVKVALARVTELGSRLKPNGRLTGYSPLSRVLELETLALGIAGKRKMWQAFASVDRLQGVDGFDFAGLAARAEAQHAAVEACRRQAAEVAFD
jgi:hypothetical protein